MSGAILRTAVQNQIRGKLGLRAEECRVNDGPRPNARAGQVFIAVHSGRWTGDRGDYFLNELFDVAVTISVKAGHVPLDRWGGQVTSNMEEAVEFLARKVLAVLHFNYETMNAANNAIPGDVSGFVEPLKFRDGGVPQERGPEWWGSASQGNYAGVSQTMTFSEARRVQKKAEFS